MYCYNHKGAIDGLVTWSSNSADSNDISNLEIRATLIYGSCKVRVTDKCVGACKHLLTTDTLDVKIGGGDHQFGSHVIKPEDHLATISPDQQHMQIIKATSKIIQKVAEQ